MQQLKQNEANADYRWIFFTCYDPDSADAYAPKTGLTFASGELKIAKAGLAAANALNYAGVVEAGRGGYWYPAAATELNTLGPLMLITDKTDVYADPTVVQVVATNPNDATNFGLGNLDAAISTGGAAAVVAALLAEEIDGETIEKILAIAGAVGAAKRSISGGTFILRDLADTKNLVAATVDGNGNVTSTTIG